MHTDTLTVLYQALASLTWSKYGYGIYSKVFDQAIEEVQNQIIMIESENDDDPDFALPD